MSSKSQAYTITITADGYEIRDEHGNYVDGYDRREGRKAEDRLNALNTRAAELAAVVPDPATWEPVSAEDELDRRERELAARCDCFATGCEQQRCLDAGRPMCEPDRLPLAEQLVAELNQIDGQWSAS